VTDCEVEYGPTVAYGSAVPCGGTPYSDGTDVTAGLSGLEVEKTYHYRVTATNPNGVHEGIDRTFTTHAVAGVTTGEPTGVTRTSATLTGAFVGNGEETTAYFEWGKTAAYGNSTPVTTSTGTGSTPVSAELTELLAYTATSGTYHCRLVASNSKGTSYGEDILFHTLLPDKPSIGSSAARSVGELGATLVATVNPQGAPAGVRFEYGLTSSLESVAEIGEPLQPDSSDHEVSTALEGLVPGSIYHFRVVASNFAGATIGPELEFHTPSPPAIGDEAASGVGATEATLSAGVKAGFQDTSYRIEYGPNLGYGGVAAQGSIGGSDNETHLIRGSVSGLSPGVTYHFRVVAQNASGNVVGPDRIFSTGTLPSQVVPKQAKCRKGFAKRHGKCVRVRHRRHKKHRKVRADHHG
jgi:phosphodiesterase/alkaline phosphatase D-like protein